MYRQYSLLADHIRYVLADHVQCVLLIELYRSICKVNDSDNM